MTGIIGALISSLGFGTANVVIKKSLSSLSIPQVLTMSTLSGVFFLGLFVLLSGASEQITIELLLTAALLACGEITLYLIVYKTFAVSNVTVAAAVSSAYPIFAAIFTALVFAEVIRVDKIPASLLLIFGAILTSIDWRGAFKNGLDKKDLVRGLNWIILMTLVHAVYFPTLGKFTAGGSWEVRLLLVKIFSVLVMFVVFFLIRKQRILPPKAKMPFTSLLGFLEVIGWIGFSWAVSSSAGQTALIIVALNSSALVTAIWAYFLLNEKLSKLQYLGIIIIVVSLVGLSL